MFPGVSGRIGSGSSVECIHLQAGVVGQRPASGCPGNLDGLLFRVGLKGFTVLNHIRNVRKIEGGKHFEVPEIEDVVDFLKFVCIAGSDDEFHTVFGF